MSKVIKEAKLQVSDTNVKPLVSHQPLVNRSRTHPVWLAADLLPWDR